MHFEATHMDRSNGIEAIREYGEFESEVAISWNVISCVCFHSSACCVKY